MSPADPNTGQLAFPLVIDDKASFENFWVGQNHELVQALRSSVCAGGARVVYFYGPPGSGKSHLIFAALRLAREEVVRTSYLSLSDDSITIDMLQAVDVKYLVCVDNIHAWAGDIEKERALFTLFEQIKHAGGCLLVSAQQPPEATNFVIHDLVSRLSSGLIYPLCALTDEQRFEALKQRARQRGLRITDEVLTYLLSRSPRDTAALFTLLDKIDRASLAEKRRVTIPFLQDLLKRSS